MHTFKSKIEQLITVFTFALSIFLVTASFAYASNVFVSDTVTADETNEDKTIAVWLDAQSSNQIDVSYTITPGTATQGDDYTCLLYTSPSPRDRTRSRMPSSA